MARLGIQSERIKHLVDTQVLPFLLAAGNVAALTNLLNAEFPLATDSCRRAWDHSHSIISGTVEPAWILGSRRKALANTVTNTVSRAMLSIHAGFRAISKKRALNYY